MRLRLGWTWGQVMKEKLMTSATDKSREENSNNNKRLSAFLQSSRVYNKTHNFADVYLSEAHDKQKHVTTRRNIMLSDDCNFFLMESHQECLNSWKN